MGNSPSSILKGKKKSVQQIHPVHKLSNEERNRSMPVLEDRAAKFGSIAEAIGRKPTIPDKTVV